MTRYNTNIVQSVYVHCLFTFFVNQQAVIALECVSFQQWINEGGSKRDPFAQQHNPSQAPGM